MKKDGIPQKICGKPVSAHEKGHPHVAPYGDRPRLFRASNPVVAECKPT